MWCWPHGEVFFARRQLTRYIINTPPMPELNTLEEELVVLIRERLLETPPEFSATSNLYDAGLDSMAIMQLLLLIEEKYGVMLPDSDLSKENFSSPHFLAVLLQKRLAEA